MKKRLSEGAIDKAVVMVRAKLDLKYRVLRGFRKPGMNQSDAFIACLEKGCEGVALTKEDRAAIASDMARQLAYRMERRRLRDERPKI